MIIPRYRDIFNCYADFSSDNHKSFGQDNNIKRRVIAMKKRDKSRFPQDSDGTKVYKPHDVISAGQEYVVTDNYTAPNGRVYITIKSSGAECRRGEKMGRRERKVAIEKPPQV